MERLFDIPVASLKLLTGGANNRVYLLNDDYIVKEYFQHPQDPRRRLDTEYEFLKFAWENGLKQIPKPLMRDANRALYTKVPGNIVQNSSPEIVKQSITFFLELNRYHEKGRHLPYASDAALSLQIALDSVKERLNRLRPVLPSFTNHLYSLYNACTNIPKNVEIQLSPDSLRLSPSDFGLHNILVHESKAYFLDFEYAGWDDPAKTICDFFTSPRIPVSKELFWDFAKTVSKMIPDPDHFFNRLHLHFPLSQIKWCCVMLNIFLKTDEERRKFSKSDFTFETQLEKATKYIQHFSMEIPHGIR